MKFKDYLIHYANIREMSIFFGESFLALVFCFIIIFVYYKLLSFSVPQKNRRRVFSDNLENGVERFYEIIFSGASILSFLSIYYLIDRFMQIDKYRAFWDHYKDFLLLIMIILSIVLNNIVDRIIIPLKKVSKTERASVRIMGMIYVILIFIYIKFIYENNNYDGFIMYFMGLMIGRFVYFDASFFETLGTIKKALLNTPIMIIGLFYTGIMCYLGFKSKYLLISNGVLVSTFIAHIFMIISIFILYHSKIIRLFTYNMKGCKDKK